MKIITETRTYIFKADYEGIASNREAEIIFDKTWDSKYWEFRGCEFGTKHKIYNKEDWDFLREIANKIDEIQKELQ